MATSFRRYLWGGLAITGVAALAVCAATYSMALAIYELAPSAHQGEQSDSRLTLIVAGVRELESSQRTYLLAGDPASLLRYHDHRRRFLAGLDSLQADTALHPAIQARLPLLTDLGRRRVGALDHGVTLHRQGAPDQARDFVLAGTGRRLMDSLATEVEHLQHELAKSQTALAATAAGRARVLAIGIGFVVLVGCAGIATAFGQLARTYAAGRQRGEQRLAAERDRIQAILQTIPDPIFVKETDGRYLMVNEAARQVYDKPLDRILGTDDTAHFPETVARAIMQTDRGIMDSGRERVIEEQVPGPDGVRTYLSTKAPLRDAAGTIIGLVGVARDITDRVRSHAEREALLNRERVALLEARAARDSLESVLNRIAEGFVALDRGWRYTYVNPKAAALFGREPASLIGRHIWTEFPEGIGQPFHLAYERAMATQQPQTFEQYYEPWAQWYVNRVYPSPDGVSIFFEDITAAKAREAEAHAHQAHLTAVLAATPLAVITYDLAGRITGWHGAAERIFGWSAEEVVGRSSPLFSADYPEEQDLLAERIRSGVAWSGRETMRLRKDGRTIPVSIWTANLCDRDGAIIGGVGTYEDISPRWLAEQERERLVADLRDLSRHLESVREEERLRIAREIHDQLGQTLTGLRLEVDWLAQHAGHGLPTEAEHLDRVATVTTELLGSVRRIAQELRPPLLDDLGLAEALDYHLQEFGARTGLECEFDAPDLDPALDGATATGLYRVAQEALTNVVRHAQAHRVTVRLSAGVDGVRLSVADDGRGFDPAGARIQRTLGLVGMRERLAALGGELRVVSAPGAGTVVTALIPRPAAATAA